MVVAVPHGGEPRRKRFIVPDTPGPLPAGGVSAPAQAAMLWAIREGEAVVGRRRAAAARERERLAGALEGTTLSFPEGHGHLVWLGSTEHDGSELARHLASRRIFVTPGTAWQVW